MTSVTNALLGDPGVHRGYQYGQSEFGTTDSFYSRQSGKELCDETSCTNPIRSASCKCGGGETCCDCRGHLCFPNTNLIHTFHSCCHFYEVDSHVMTSNLPTFIPDDNPKDTIPSKHPSSGDIPFLSATSSYSSLHGTPIEINTTLHEPNPQLVHRTSSQPNSDYYVTPSSSASNLQSRCSKTTCHVEGNTRFFSWSYNNGSKESPADDGIEKDDQSKSGPSTEDKEFHEQPIAGKVDSIQDISVIYRNTSQAKPSMAAVVSIPYVSLKNVDREKQNEVSSPECMSSGN